MTPESPLFIVLNKASGNRDANEAEAIIRNVFEQAGRRYDLAIVNHARRLPILAKRAVELAQQQHGAVIAAGGDGTLNTVASMVLNSGRPFGVLPLGTFNYFGRAHGIPEDTAKAAQVLLDAAIKPVQVGLLNGHPFLVNASLGLYPRLLEERESYKQQFGRSRVVALCAGVITLLRTHRHLVLSLEHEGCRRTLRTLTLFVGNNALQLEQAGIAQADAVEQGQLVALMARPVGTLALLGLMRRGALGQLGDADNLVCFTFKQLTIRPHRRRRVKAAMDGEVIWLRTPLTFEIAPRPLPLLAPANSPEDVHEGSA